nr:hypothetical protein [Candidatus Enterovibrio escacola]
MTVYAVKVILDITIYFATDSEVNIAKYSGNLVKGTTHSQSFLNIKSVIVI